jgi:hypothetical protein
VFDLIYAPVAKDLSEQGVALAIGDVLFRALHSSRVLEAKYRRRCEIKE